MTEPTQTRKRKGPLAKLIEARAAFVTEPTEANYAVYLARTDDVLELIDEREGPVVTPTLRFEERVDPLAGRRYVRVVRAHYFGDADHGHGRAVA